VFSNSNYNTYVKRIREIFDIVGNTEVICAYLDPDQNLFDEGEFFIYGTLTTQLKRRHSFYTRFGFNLNIEEYF
jgi:hypothetical protein